MQLHLLALPIIMLGFWCIGLASTKVLSQSSTGCLSSNQEANYDGPEHLSLKVQQVKFEFNVSAQALSSNAVMSRN